MHSLVLVVSSIMTIQYAWCAPACNGDCDINTNSIKCNSGACDVQCNNDQNACFTYNIECVSGTTCNIYCQAWNACSSAVITASSAETLSIFMSHDNAVAHATIYCPTSGDGSTTICNLQSDDQYAGEMAQFAKIYAINGFDDVNISCPVCQYNNVAPGLKIYCGSGFSQQCTLDNSVKSFDKCESNTYCEASITSNPTLTPTTTIPTGSPTTTLTPTFSPITASPTTLTPITTLSPTSSPTTASPTTSVPTATPITTLTPTFSPITASPTTLTPTATPITTLTPTSSPITTSSPTASPTMPVTSSTITSTPTALPTTAITTSPTASPTPITTSPTTPTSPPTASPITTSPTALPSSISASTTTVSSISGSSTSSPTILADINYLINITISFEMKNVTLTHEIEDILSVIIITIINEGIENITISDCYSDDYEIDIKSIENNQTNSINISAIVGMIALCDNINTDTLKTYFVHNLKGDLIDLLKNEQDILLTADSINIIIDKTIITQKTTQTTLINSTFISFAPNNNDINNEIVYILIILGMIVLCGIVSLCLYFVYIIKKGKEKEIVNDVNMMEIMPSNTYSNHQVTHIVIEHDINNHTNTKGSDVNMMQMMPNTIYSNNQINDEKNYNEQEGRNECFEYNMNCDNDVEVIGNDPDTAGYNMDYISNNITNGSR